VVRDLEVFIRGTSGVARCVIRGDEIIVSVEDSKDPLRELCWVLDYRVAQTFRDISISFYIDEGRIFFRAGRADR